jgi:hypothetical protein
VALTRKFRARGIKMREMLKAEKENAKHAKERKEAYATVLFYDEWFHA